MRMCPCKDCGERRVEPNCHDKCPLSARGDLGYDEWTAEIEAERQDFRDRYVVTAYNKDKSDRLSKRMGWKQNGQL